MDNGLLEISSARQLQDLLAKDIGSSLTVAHFWAPWCDASAQMSDVIKELAKLPECKGVQFVQIEAEELPEVSQAYAVTAIPTFVFIQDGKSIDRLDGALASELTKRVRQHAASAHFISSPSVVQATSASVSREAINERLTSLVNSSPMIIFMKGSPDSPQCGFSKQLVSLLRDHNADFKTFDILKDEQVRQGLKEYSNWPTYPQVYINGELIGGLDIVKELLETKEKLPKKKLLEENAKFETFNILDDEEVRQGLKAYSNWPTYPQVYVDGQLVGGLDIIKELKEAGELNSTLKLSDRLAANRVGANNDHQKTASPGVSRSVGINANLQLTSLQSTSAVRCLQSSLKENRHKAVFRKPTKVLTQRDILSSDDSEALAFAYSENKAIRGQHAIGQLHKSVVCFKVRWLGMPNKSWSNGFQIIRASQIRDHAKLHLVPGLIVNVRWKKQLWPAKIMKRVCLSIPTTTSVALALAASNSSFAVVTESENSATTSLQGHSVLQSQKPLPEADILSSCFKCCLCNLLFDGSVIADHVGDAHLNGYLPYQCAELNLRTASAKRMQMAFLSRKLLVPETPISVIHKHDQVRELLLRVIVEASLQPENVFAMFEKSPGLIRSLEQMDEAFAPGFMQQTASTPVLKKPLRSTAAGQKNGNAIVSQTRKKRVRRVSVSVGGANGTTDASLAPKKPRGRPRKQTPCSGSHAEVQLESSSLEKSGIELCIDDVVAKRKVGDVNADLTSSWKASSAIKRPRGRPRKDAASVPPGLAALQFSGDASVLKMKALPRIASVRTRETELGSENVLCSSPEF